MSKNLTKYDIKPCPDCGTEEFPSFDITKFEVAHETSRTVSFECSVCGYCTNPHFEFKDAVNEWNEKSNKRWNPYDLPSKR